MQIPTIAILDYFSSKMLFRNNCRHIFFPFPFFAVFLFLFLFTGTLSAQSYYPDETPELIYNLLRSKSPIFDSLLNNPSKYKLQIIYTQINRDKKNKPNLKSFYYRHLPDEYFYPASIVKLPLAALTLEKLNSLKIKGLTKDTKLEIKSVVPCQTSVRVDSNFPDIYTTLGSYISKALIVSNNDAYNRLYDFTGQKYILKCLRKKGLKKARIIHWFAACDSAYERKSNDLYFYDKKGEVIYHRPSTLNKKKIKKPIKNMAVGKANYDFNQNLINHPKDFSNKNYFSLDDITSVLTRIVFPGNFTHRKRFKLKDADYEFLLRNLVWQPSESNIHAIKDSPAFYNSMTNYFIYGHDKKAFIDTNVQIFNIVGQAYGFLTDCAYIVDFSKNIEFFLSATIYVNEDQVLNDDVYEYNSTGFPFFKNVGLLFYNYEIQRKRTNTANLDYFKKVCIDLKK